MYFTHNYFFILLNNTLSTINKYQDKIFKCSQQIYSDVNSYEQEIMHDGTRLYAFLEKSCSIARRVDVTEHIFPKTILYQSHINHSIYMITHHNSTVFEYTEKSFDTNDITFYHNNDAWSNWILTQFNTSYSMICKYALEHNCLQPHNPDILSHIQNIFTSVSNAFLGYNIYNNVISDDNINSTDSYYNMVNTNNSDLSITVPYGMLNTHNITWQGIVVGIFCTITMGYSVNKIINCIKQQYCTSHAQHNTELQPITQHITVKQVEIVKTPAEAIQMAQIETKHKIMFGSCAVNIDQSLCEHEYEAIAQNHYYENVHDYDEVANIGEIVERPVL